MSDRYRNHLAPIQETNKQKVLKSRIPCGKGMRDFQVCSGNLSFICERQADFVTKSAGCKLNLEIDKV